MTQLIDYIGNNFQFYFLIIFVIQALSTSLFYFLVRNSIIYKFQFSYNAKQKIHEGFIPRIGGLIIFSTILVTSFFNYEGSELIKLILICFIPIFTFALLEDIFNNVLPSLRLFSIFLSCFCLVILINSDLPFIDIPFLSQIFQNNHTLIVIFFIICLAGVTNAFNLIDGINGLLILTSLSIILSLILIAFKINDFFSINILLPLLFILFIQLLTNFPKAFIFSGDLGAYGLGFFIGSIMIFFFGTNNNLLTWLAVLILIYPTFETLFTIARRFFLKKPIMQPDTLHLHHLFLNFLKRNTRIKRINALVSALMFPIWFFPTFWIYCTLDDISLSFILLGIIFFILIYCFTYIILYHCLKYSH